MDRFVATRWLSVALALALSASIASGREVGKTPLGEGLTETSELQDEAPDAAQTIELLLQLPKATDLAVPGKPRAPADLPTSPLRRDKLATVESPKVPAAPAEAASNAAGAARDERPEGAALGAYRTDPTAPRLVPETSDQVIGNLVPPEGLSGHNLAEPEAYEDRWLYRALQFARDNAWELAIALVVGLALTWLVSALLTYAWRTAPRRRQHRHHSHRSTTALYVPILTPSDRPAPEPPRHRRHRRRHHHRRHDPLSASAGPADDRGGGSADSSARTSRRRRARYRGASSA